MSIYGIIYFFELFIRDIPDCPARCELIDLLEKFKNEVDLYE